jgi:VWFA-related protein
MSTQRISSVLLLLLLATGAVASYAQAGRNQTKTEGKTNQRPSTPPATPTPFPPAKETANAADDGDVIKISTQLVSIPVRVMDKKGRFIGGLGKESFNVFEDGVQQDIAMFSNEHEPFTVALMLDMSYSTTFKVAEIQNAAIQFIDQLRPRDKVMVISFDEDVHVLCDATHDRQEIYRAIKSTKIGTGTSLYEAVGNVMNERLRHIDGRKAIILLTDGVDTTSRRDNDLGNLADAMELDALIYPIRYDTFEDVQSMKNRGTIAKPPPITAPIPTSGKLPFPLPQTVGSPSSEGTTPEEYQKAKEYLEQLALRTGGRIYDANSLVNMADAFSKIASELREFYSLGYYPKDDRKPGKTTSIKVKVDQPGLVVKTREGYIVPHKTKIKTN